MKFKYWVGFGLIDALCLFIGSGLLFIISPGEIAISIFFILIAIFTILVIISGILLKGLLPEVFSNDWGKKNG